MRSFSSLMVSSLRLRLPCKELTRDSAACTSVEWSAALAARTAASRSSTWFHTPPVYVTALLGRAGLHFRCIPDANSASQEQIVHPRSRLCIPDANYASQEQILHPRRKLRIPGADLASQLQTMHPTHKSWLPGAKCAKAASALRGRWHRAGLHLHAL